MKKLWRLYWANGKEDVIAHFENKYGRRAVEIIIGKGVEIEVPPYVAIVHGVAQPEHVLVR